MLPLISSAVIMHQTLIQLSPSEEELLQAVRWAKTHDPSEGFQTAIKLFLREFGYERLVNKI
jgi:hypothetical protein